MRLYTSNMNPAECVVEHDTIADRPLSFKDLLVQTLWIVIPADVSSLLWMSSQVVTLSYVGRNLGELAVAQYSAGLIILNMAGFSFIYGFGAAIDTLASQAYGKDNNTAEVGEILQFTLVVNTILSIIICICFWFCAPVMIAVFGTDVGEGVVTFLRWSPAYMFAQVVSGVISKVMYAQKLPEVVMLANLAAACTAPIANYFLTPLGLHGAVMALFFTSAFSSVAYILCCIFHPRVVVRNAQWPTPRLLHRPSWKAFFAVGVPSLVATCVEWWAFEFQAILAVQVSSEAMAIHGVSINLISLLYSIAVGVSVSASVMVGNALGGMQPKRAEQYAHFIIHLNVVICLVTALGMITFGGAIARVFSNEEQLINGVKSIVPIVALTHVGDSMQSCMQGVFRGAGRPKEASILVLSTLWGVGVPASSLLVLWFKVGVKGCLGGLCIGFAFEIPMLLYWIYRFDWNAYALEAQHDSADYVVLEETSSPVRNDDSLDLKKGDTSCRPYLSEAAWEGPNLSHTSHHTPLHSYRMDSVPQREQRRVIEMDEMSVCSRNSG